MQAIQFPEDKQGRNIGRTQFGRSCLPAAFFRACVFGSFFVPFLLNVDGGVRAQNASAIAPAVEASKGEAKGVSKPESAFVPPHPIASDVMKNWPAYPESAKMANQQGIVLLSVRISAKGEPLDVRVKKSSSFQILDQSAVAAVRRWHFAPATRDNVPIEMDVTLPINFSLKQEQPSAASAQVTPAGVKTGAPKAAASGAHDKPVAKKSPKPPEKPKAASMTKPVVTTKPVEEPKAATTQ